MPQPISIKVLKVISKMFTKILLKNWENEYNTNTAQKLRENKIRKLQAKRRQLADTFLFWIYEIKKVNKSVYIYTYWCI